MLSYNTSILAIVMFFFLHDRSEVPPISGLRLTFSLDDVFWTSFYETKGSLIVCLLDMMTVGEPDSDGNERNKRKLCLPFCRLVQISPSSFSICTGFTRSTTFCLLPQMRSSFQVFTRLCLCLAN